MTNNDDFTIRRGWKIQTWPGNVDTPPPFMAAFEATRTTLLIAKDLDSGVVLYLSLYWLDENRQMRTMTGFFLDSDGKLVAKSVPLGEETYTVILSISDSTLTGDIYVTSSGPYTEGIVGTFTAVANPDGVICPAHQKSPRWLRWFRRLIHRLDVLEERTATS